MLDNVFKGLFDSTSANVIAVGDFLLCLLVSLVIGAFLAAASTYKSRHSQSFVITLALIPAVVCVVIMMVNGNIGAGVAVAGAFSLVRFRSAPGTAREIGAIFIAMGSGLATGMGYLGYGVLFALILGGISLLYARLGLGDSKKAPLDKVLQITIPEDLDYSGVFDDLMQTYTDHYEVVKVKTTNMGSLFKLTYHIHLKAADQEKAFIDELRCRNGNLEINLSLQETGESEL